MCDSLISPFSNALANAPTTAAKFWEARPDWVLAQTWPDAPIVIAVESEPALLTL